MEIVFPIDGDMLHARDGAVEDGRLRVQVVVNAEAGSSVRIGGVRALEEEGCYLAGVVLSGYDNTILVRNETTGEEKRVRVYWLPNFANGYRLSIDDNIWFLRDIHENEKVYNSIFDNSYLAFLRGVHDVYGTKIHINLFYETDGFNLSQLTDRFAAEWKAQSSWLRLSFHALGEFPDKPYQQADYVTVKRDGQLVMNEIRRFAGPQLMGPVTTLHWGEATIEGSRALRDLGYKGQLGYFNVDDELPAVSYYLDVQQRRHIKKRFVWKDNQEDIVFIRSSIVIDKTGLADIRPHLDAYREKGGLPPYVDLLVHEQYYYPFYFNYQPDFRERILTAVGWAANNGYEPRFLEECIF
ncbi:hypothetical protein ACQ86N_12665 [Puia sp. P3]|uniref:hypothetical protein n=1 Tax=Puia sp. P3 TaxID=3423952 RepID=UPI003D6656AF